MDDVGLGVRVEIHGRHAQRSREQPLVGGAAIAAEIEGGSRERNLGQRRVLRRAQKCEERAHDRIRLEQA